MKLLVYPMNKSLAPLGRYGDMLESFDQAIPVSPRSFGYGTEDIAVIDGGTKTGVTLTCDLESALSQCDAIYMDWYPAANISEQQNMDIVDRSVDMGKRVFLSEDLFSRLKDRGQERIAQLPIKVLGYNTENITLNEEKRLLDIPVPCVLVFGSGDFTNKFDIQLGLRREFQKAGYKVTQLGTKKYSSLFGFDPLPQFIMETGDLREKILNFNHYIYEKVKSENSDVVVIGVPGSIMQNNPYEFTEFGEIAFLIGSALKADAAILSLYCAPYPEETLQYLLDICKYRFNAPAHYVNLACNDMMLSAETLQFQTLSIPIERVKSEILPQVKCPSTKTFTAMDSNSMEKMAGAILEEFETNIF